MKALSLTLVLTACGQVTPGLDIAVACNPSVTECSPDLRAIDAAAEAAAALVGIPASDFKNAAYVDFNADAIYLEGKKYYGLCETSNDFVSIQVEYTGCLFDKDSALVHEFTHGALFLRDGDRDDSHSMALWHEVDGLRSRLSKVFCQ